MFSQEEKDKIMFLIEHQTKYKTKKELLEAIRKMLIQSSVKLNNNTYTLNQTQISIKR